MRRPNNGIAVKIKFYFIFGCMYVCMYIHTYILFGLNFSAGTNNLRTKSIPQPHHDSVILKNRKRTKNVSI